MLAAVVIIVLALAALALVLFVGLVVGGNADAQRNRPFPAGQWLAGQRRVPGDFLVFRADRRSPRTSGLARATYCCTCKNSNPFHVRNWLLNWCGAKGIRYLQVIDTLIPRPPRDDS
jgi:hypothetical protein